MGAPRSTTSSHEAASSSASVRGVVVKSATTTSTGYRVRYPRPSRLRRLPASLPVYQWNVRSFESAHDRRRADHSSGGSGEKGHARLVAAFGRRFGTSFGPARALRQRRTACRRLVPRSKRNPAADQTHCRHHGPTFLFFCVFFFARRGQGLSRPRAQTHLIVMIGRTPSTSTPSTASSPITAPKRRLARYVPARPGGRRGRSPSKFPCMSRGGHTRACR